METQKIFMAIDVGRSLVVAVFNLVCVWIYPLVVSSLTPHPSEQMVLTKKGRE